MPRTKLLTGASLLLRLVVGGAFAVAAVLKLRDPSAFAEQIGNYQLLPELSNYIAVALPSLELLAAAILVLGAKAWRQAAALLFCGMLLMFTTAIARAWALGINLECGCFGVGSTSIGPWPILRNLGLVCALGLALHFEFKARTDTASP